MTQADRVVAESDNLRAKAPVVYVTMFDYDFSVTNDPSGSTPISNDFVPVGAIVIGGWYEVTTTFTSSGDSATLALSVVGANDLVTAIAIDDGSNPWDVNLTQRRPLKSITTQVATEKQVAILGGVEAVTAGKLIGVVEWILPENRSTGH